jgi:hypothetical protein
MVSKPKTFKIYIPGEVLKRVEHHTLLDGSEIIVETKAKIVVPSKKNQQRMAVVAVPVEKREEKGKEFTVIPIASLQHEKWHKRHLKLFNQVVNDMAAKGFSLPIARAKIKVLFYFPDSIERDLSNKFETIADIMVDAGILLDDHFKVLKPVFLDGFVNRERPRTEIYLTLITGDMPEYNWDITPPEYEAKRQERRRQVRRIRIDRQRRSAATGL